MSDRPWPQRAPAPGPWSATLIGSGDRITFTTDGVVVDGLRHTTVDLGSSDPRLAPSVSGESERVTNRSVALPDGSRWYPREPFRLEAEGDLAFTAEGRTGNESLLGDQAFTTAAAVGNELSCGHRRGRRW